MKKLLMQNLISILALSSALVACNHSSFSASAPSAGNIPSKAMSWMTVSSPNWADGMTPAEITVQIRNADGSPLTGVTLLLTVSGSENVLVPCTPSDANGMERCRVYSTNPEVKEFKLQGSIVLNATVDFQRVKPFMSTFAIVTSSGNDTLPAGQKIISTSGIVEDPTQLMDGSGTLRAHTSILGSVLSN